MRVLTQECGYLGESISRETRVNSRPGGQIVPAMFEEAQGKVSKDKNGKR